MQHPPASNGMTGSESNEEAMSNLTLNDQEWPILGRSQPRVEHSSQTRRGGRRDSQNQSYGQQQHSFDDRRGRPYRGGRNNRRGSAGGGRRARYGAPIPQRNRTVSSDPAVVMASATPPAPTTQPRARYAYVPPNYIPPHLFVQQQQAVEQMYWSSLQQQHLMAVAGQLQQPPQFFTNPQYFNQFSPMVQPNIPAPTRPAFEEEPVPHVGTVRSTAFPPTESDPNLPPMIDTIPRSEDKPVVLRYKPPRPQFDCQTERIVYQVEYYFSDYNLSRDVFVRSNMDTRGRIDLHLLATFNAIRSEGVDLETLRAAINHSALVCVDDELKVGKRIRPGIAPVPYPESIKSYEEQVSGARVNEQSRSTEEMEKIGKLKTETEKEPTDGSS